MCLAQRKLIGKGRKGSTWQILCRLEHVLSQSHCELWKPWNYCYRRGLEVTLWLRGRKGTCLQNWLGEELSRRHIWKLLLHFKFTISIQIVWLWYLDVRGTVGGQDLMEIMEGWNLSQATFELWHCLLYGSYIFPVAHRITLRVRSSSSIFQRL